MVGRVVFINTNSFASVTAESWRWIHCPMSLILTFPCKINLTDYPAPATLLSTFLSLISPAIRLLQSFLVDQSLVPQAQRLDVLRVVAELVVMLCSNLPSDASANVVRHVMAVAWFTYRVAHTFGNLNPKVSLH